MVELPLGPGDAEDDVDWRAVCAHARRFLSPRMGGVPVQEIEDAVQEACRELLTFVRRKGKPRSLEGIVFVISRGVAADAINRVARERVALSNPDVAEAMYPTHARDLEEAIETTFFLIRGYLLLEHSPCVEILDVRLRGGTLEDHASSRGVSSAQVRQAWCRCMERVRDAVRRGRLKLPLFSSRGRRDD